MSPDGRVLSMCLCPEDRDLVAEFALKHGLITRRDNLTNVYKLLDASSGSNEATRLLPAAAQTQVAKGLKQIDKTTKRDLPRAPEPVLGGTPEFLLWAALYP